MYDIHRVTARATVLLALALVLVALGAALRPALGGRPAWLPETESMVDTSLFRKAGERVAAAHRELSRSNAEGSKRLGVMTGASALMYDVNPVLIDTGPDWRWLSITANSANVVNDCELADLALWGGLRPAVLLVVANTSQLAVIRTLLDDRTSFDPDELRFHMQRREWLEAQSDAANLMLIPWNRILPNRSRISGYLRQRLFLAQQDLFQAIGYSLDAIYPPDPSPWTVKHPYPNTTHMDPGWDAFVERQFRKYHVFEPSVYSPDSPGVRTLSDLTRRARAVGSDVIFVMVPERSSLRKRMPLEAEETLPRVSAASSEILVRRSSTYAMRWTTRPSWTRST